MQYKIWRPVVVSNADEVVKEGPFYIITVHYSGDSREEASDVWARLANEKGIHEFWEDTVRRSRITE